MHDDDAAASSIDEVERGVTPEAAPAGPLKGKNLPEGSIDRSSTG
jgi:hypothetical protein